MTLKLGTQTGSLINHVLSDKNGTVPQIGMGATLLYWSDRQPATIVDVQKGGKLIAIQRDNAERIDSNGMSESQEYKYSPNVAAPLEWYQLRKNGSYVKKGESLRHGQRLAIGYREKYYDFSF